MALIQHFILTRFNLRLWKHDKNGRTVRSDDWLADRFDVFEKYCFPSVVGQSCQDFEWIVLFDSETSEYYRQRIDAYKDLCPQFVPVFVKPEHGRYFGQIFKKIVCERIKSERVITTYLDNDDAINVGFVGDVQQRALNLVDKTFISYSDGVQYYTDMHLLLKVHYPRNHFMSVIEAGDRSSLKTIYGYGSHYYIEKISGAAIEYIKDCLMWCEVIHERNMGNDAYFLFNTKMITQSNVLREDFSINQDTQSGLSLYLLKFIPRYIKTFIRRVGYFLFGRRW